MKKIAFFIFLFLSEQVYGFNLHQTVLDLQKNYDSTQNWQADFQQTTYVDLIDKNIVKNGELTVQKPSALRLDYKGEGARHYISNGDKLWVYAEGDSQVLVYTKISKILATEALTFLKGLGNLQKEFVIDLFTSSNTNEAMMTDKNLVLLQLIPRNQSDRIEKIILGLNQKNIIQELTLFNQSENKSHYTFKNIRFNKAFDPAFFELKKDAGMMEVEGN